ncbi:MAG TPA: hypothetical protein VGR18_08095 [Rubrobacter sp.]|nr:hypothetical protein [Rubrobacter sp.]
MSAATRQTVGGAADAQSPNVIDAKTFEPITVDWPEVAESAADGIVETYGQPNEAIPGRLVRYANGSRKRTVVYRREIPHEFPQPHSDVVERLVDRRVPPPAPAA